MPPLESAGYVTDVTYIPGFYPNLAPTAMRHVAALNRVMPPAVDDGFRYVELGCGLGRSLATLAAANPRGDFLGVDINPSHTAQATKDIEAGGLTNARVVTADFAHLPDEVRDADFITLHGVWSWVAPEVRTDILRVARERLASGGLLLVSYNAMPGWAHLLPIRGILRQYATLRPGDSAQRAREAVEYLAFQRDQGAKYFQDNPGAAKYVDTIRGQDPRYLAHEYLNEHWTSFYFAEVAAQFGSAGLTFAGSLPVHCNFWDLCVAPSFQELFRTTSDRLVTEAHKDFCANTMFRWDLFAKDPRPLPDAAARARSTADLRYRVARPGLRLPYSANLGVVTSTVQGRPTTPCSRSSPDRASRWRRSSPTRASRPRAPRISSGRSTPASPCASSTSWQRRWSTCRRDRCRRGSTSRSPSTARSSPPNSSRAGACRWPARSPDRPSRSVTSTPRSSPRRWPAVRRGSRSASTG